MYCETQPRFQGKVWLDLFPDEAFPNDTPEDKIRSETDCTHNVYSASFCISVAFSIDCDIVYVHIHVWQCFL